MDKQDILLARQPIYNQKKEVVAYELLFRESDQDPITKFDGNRATSRVLLNLFTETDLATVTGGLPAFINFTKELLESPPLFDTESIVIEVLEDIEISSELIKQIKSLKEKGFTIALDDYVTDEKYRPILKYVDIIKLELPEMVGDDLKATIEELKPFNVKLLAEKVETPEQFRQCAELGCEMFQGYFLSKPQEVKGSKIAGNKLAVIELISEIQNPDITIPELTQVITKDPALSYNLLKLINSAAFRRSNKIESIHMAVNLMGLDRIKSWASLLALSKIDDKPQSLHYLALLRAMVCERIAEKINPSQKDKFYTVGLLSCLDAFFDSSIEKIVADISLEPDITNALLEHKGHAGLALNTVINFEESHWSKVDWATLSQHGLTAKDINQMYYECSQETLNQSAH